MANIFDPNAFLDLEITEASVRRPPLPVGDYNAVITDVAAGTWTGKAGGSADGQTGMKYNLKLKVDLPQSLQTELGLKQDSITLSDGIMLDLNEGGTIDTGPGKNPGLRRYRDALDMNKPGEPFKARNMIGRPIKVRITHELYQNEIQERVGGVARP